MIKLLLFLCLLNSCICRRFNNPVIKDSTSEPGVVKYEDLYYAVGSAEFGSSSLPIYTSSDLQTWEINGYAFTEGTFPAWATIGLIMSPEIRIVGDRNYLLYFWAYDVETEMGALGVATALNILGPYTSTDRPLLVNISQDLRQPTVMNDFGAAYLLWSGWGDGLIYGQKLQEDGLGFIDSSSTVLITPTLDWEGSTLEAPTTFITNEYYYIGYSTYCNCVDCNGIGIARSKFPLGPYEKLDAPILAPNERFLSTAQPSIVKDLNNEDSVLLFHATVNMCTGPYLCAASLAWNNASWPYVADFSSQE